MDFAKLLPFLGAAATGGIPALATVALGKISEVLGVEIKSADDAARAIEAATPEQKLALLTAENDFKLKSQALGFANAKAMAELSLATQTLYVQDTNNARKEFSQNERVFWLGVVILTTFALLAGAALYGAFLILHGGLSGLDNGTVAAVSTFVGSVIGYVAANAQSVVGFFFGSSQGSKDKTDAMADAVKGLGAR